MTRKFLLAIITISICMLCGCSDVQNIIGMDNYEDGYEQGHEDGYNDNYENNDYNEDSYDFQRYIVNLMYDRKYDFVRDLAGEFPEKVDYALEKEFGVTDIDIIIEYLEEGSQTIIGTCEICHEPVYADDMAILPDGIDCAHSSCISGNHNEQPPKINKDK